MNEQEQEREQECSFCCCVYCLLFLIRLIRGSLLVEPLLTRQLTNNLRALVSPFAQATLISPWMNFLHKSNEGRKAKRHQGDIVTVCLRGKLVSWLVGWLVVVERQFDSAKILQTQ